MTLAYPQAAVPCTDVEPAPAATLLETEAAASMAPEDTAERALGEDGSAMEAAIARGRRLLVQANAGPTPNAAQMAPVNAIRAKIKEVKSKSAGMKARKDETTGKEAAQKSKWKHSANDQTQVPTPIVIARPSRNAR